MKIVQITTDNREHHRTFEIEEPTFGAAPEALLAGFDSLGGGHEIHVISCSRQVSPAPVKLYRQVFFHQVIVPQWGWGRSGYLGCALKIRRLIREIDPDVVHGQGTERDCALSAVLSGYPNVVTIHGNMKAMYDLRFSKGLYGYIAAKLETFALRRADGILCNSGYTRGLVKPRARRVWLVPNPLRQRFFDSPLPERSGSTVPKPVFLCIGVVSPRKQQVEIMELAACWHAEGHSFLLRFIGSVNVNGHYGQRFSELVRRGEEAGFIEYCGVLSGEKLIEEMDSADACIHFPKEEAFGLVVAEALARNLVFFGANLGGIHEIARGAPGCFLSADLGGLSDDILEWLRAPARNEGGHEVMRKRFSPKTIARKHVEIYSSVLDDNR